MEGFPWDLCWVFGCQEKMGNKDENQVLDSCDGDRVQYHSTISTGKGYGSSTITWRARNWRGGV